MLFLNWADLRGVANLAGDRFRGAKVWGVPRGGTHIALLLAAHAGAEMCDFPDDANIIVDDIIDSGATRDLWKASHPDVKFWAPFDKTIPEGVNLPYIVFPWEDVTDEDPEAHFRRFLQSLGGLGLDDECMVETPARVVKAYRELTQGVSVDAALTLAKRFPVEGLDEMVIVRDIPFWSLCEHHLLPFSGTATVGYLAKGEAVGLSKIPRLVQAFARRPQMQERLAQQIAATLHEELDTQGAGCVIRGSHTCMNMRGVRSGGEMVTSHLLGNFRSDPAVRAEFLSLELGR
ncbi:MAG: GTP cyclohydrolase I FolE [Planctomycetota bacterium]|nr:GTP cyclohydrolase I FolE [Planctomycetota bacterium]